MSHQRAVPVIFRVWKDTKDVIALFPTILGDCKHTRRVESFMHVGQHSSADLDIINVTRRATPREYKALARELRAVPYRYRLRIVKRISPTMRGELRAEYERQCRR